MLNGSLWTASKTMETPARTSRISFECFCNRNPSRPLPLNVCLKIDQTEPWVLVPMLILDAILDVYRVVAPGDVILHTFKIKQNIVMRELQIAQMTAITMLWEIYIYVFVFLVYWSCWSGRELLATLWLLSQVVTMRWRLTSVLLFSLSTYR